MGRRSVRENKNIYQQYREEAGLTREQASELTEFLSDDKIEKIESGKTYARPEEALAMAKAYKKPELIRWYCSNECPIGRIYVPEVVSKELPNLVVEILSELNTLEKSKERLIDIAADNVITEEEKPDFDRICDQLSNIAESARALQLWIEKKLYLEEE